MRILLDAQLPQALVRPLERLGCDVLHTLDLPEGNRSADNLICSIADRDGRVVFSKDTDFLRGHLLHGTPAKLLIVATGNIGNIGNHDLTTLLLRVLPELNRLFETHVLIELNRKALVVRH
jgi:predicted nuclease of predicted toxin-antitoxin system